MATDFFTGTRPGRTVTHGSASFELPILYFRDELFLLFFTASLERIKRLMPSGNLHPVTLPGKRALVGIAAFNYAETSIGPYGEVGVVIPTVHGPRPPPVLLPALLESRYPGFGLLVAHLPVTSRAARDAGRGEWGYTKFVADMHFTSTPEYMECRLTEDRAHILTLRVARRGFFRRDRNPLITYSVKDRNLLRTTVLQKGSCRFSFFPGGSFLQLGDHSVSRFLRELDLSPRPFQSRYYVERSGILPAGEPVEQDVDPVEGYRGSDREGVHTTSFTP